MATSETALVDLVRLEDDALVGLARHGHREAFRHIMQRCNQRLFRVARGVVGDESETKNIVQEAYLHAFEKLDTFRGEASLLTWMTRIVLNEAYGRLRRRRHTVDIDLIEAGGSNAGSSNAGGFNPGGSDDSRVIRFPSRFGSEDPAAAAARAQIRRLVEQAIDELPEPFRIVFVMRAIEECTVEETASNLGIRAETVKTRLHRARRLLRTALDGTLSATLTDAFPFLGPRCDRMTEAVLARLDRSGAGSGG